MSYRTLYTLIMALGLGIPLAQGQTCNDEQIKFRETFGSGWNAASLPTGRTNYTYVSSGSITDGEYRLHRNSQARPEWHSSSDHTGNSNGRMMIVNASYTPGEFYRDTIEGISPLRTYSVYLYAMNLNKANNCSGLILPRLQIIVESYNADGSFTELTSIISDELPVTASPVWVRLEGYFNVPPGVSAVRYRVLNNATGGCGNDVAIDDITFSECALMMLPVSGLQLKARGGENLVELSWSTKQESNTERFEIERSVDGKTWQILGTMNAAGESHSPRQYRFEDRQPLSSSVYYRVTVRDRDGRTSRSNSVILRPAASQRAVELSVFPNPFVQRISLDLESPEAGTVTLRIFDLFGKIHRAEGVALRSGVNRVEVEGLDRLTQGTYFLEIIARDGRSMARSKLVRK